MEREGVSLEFRTKEQTGVQDHIFIYHANGCKVGQVLRACCPNPLSLFGKNL